MCVYLDGDWKEKQIQLAHISRDSSDSSYENLAVLCLSHHDRYDSKTSQSKGYMPLELLAYKERLKAAFEHWDNAPHDLVVPSVVSPDLITKGSKKISLSSPLTMITYSTLRLEPYSLKTLLMDGATRQKAIDALRKMDALSNQIQDVGDVEILQGPNLGGKPFVILLVGNKNGWSYSVLAFAFLSGEWHLQAQIIIESQKGHLPVVSFLGGSTYEAFSVEYIAMYGTGVFLKNSSWYRVSTSSISPLITYPVEGYVAGWGMSFQRHIQSRTVKPSTLSSGAKLEVVLSVSYQTEGASQIRTGR
jgi:hypothetical protein